MPLIYFSSSTLSAETFSNKIASHIQSYLEAQYIIPSYDQEFSKQKITVKKTKMTKKSAFEI